MISRLSNKIKEYKASLNLNKAIIKIKVLIHNSGIIPDDSIYKKNFDKFIGSNIHQAHLNENFICCPFCTKMIKSHCHENCFKCSLGTYKECSPLLPGTFSFRDSHINSIMSIEPVPWIFKTPCTNFERIDKIRYYKNFNSPFQAITVANYETLEGIFIGIYQNKRPCHICASVNLDIYNRCSKCDRVKENKPCSKIIKEIASKYHSISGMIKYIG